MFGTLTAQILADVAVRFEESSGALGFGTAQITAAVAVCFNQSSDALGFRDVDWSNISNRRILLWILIT